MAQLARCWREGFGLGGEEVRRGWGGHFPGAGPSSQEGRTFCHFCSGDKARFHFLHSFAHLPDLL